jgi:hypothetical protein
VNIAVLLVWAVLALVALARALDPGPWITAGLLIIALYFLAVGSTDRQPYHPERLAGTA